MHKYYRMTVDGQVMLECSETRTIVDAYDAWRGRGLVLVEVVHLIDMTDTLEEAYKPPQTDANKEETEWTF